MATSAPALWWYLSLAASALLGLVLLWAALCRDRSRGRRRCPGCWYDLSGAPPTLPLRCPECGRSISRDRDMHHTRRRWGLAAIAVILTLPLLGYFVWHDGQRAYYAVMPKWKRVETLRVEEVTVKRFVARNPEFREARVLVASSKATLLDISDADIQLGADPQRFSGGPSTPIGVGESNNDIPTLLIFSYSGGAHCCYVVHILECATPARLIATIDGRNGVGLQRVPSAKGASTELEFNISDQAFDYWHASHAESPFPSVFYRIHDHHLRLQLDRMLRPAADVLAGRPAPSATSLDPLLWGTMLDLIYSGNDAAAWEYFEANWPAGYTGSPDKAALKREFLATLEQSPQYRDFQAARSAAAAGSTPPPSTVGMYTPSSAP